MAKITMGENMKNRLLDIRLSLGYKKQKDFAKFLGIPQPQYSKYEDNEHEQPTLRTAFKIARKLNMKVDDIFYEETPSD